MKIDLRAWRQSYSRGAALSLLWRLVLLFAVVFGVGLIGWGQIAVSRDAAPFDWPYTRWMETRLWSEFRKPNDLAFAVPLFLAGGLLFAAAAPRSGLPSLLYSAYATRLRRRTLLVLAGLLLAPLAVCAWLNIRLFNHHYDVVYPWVFLAVIIIALAVLATFDGLSGRLRPPRLRRSHLLEVGVVAGITGTFIGINARDLSNWRYSTIGDDAVFYDWASRILHGEHINWFTQRGPYGYHPVLSSVWQAFNLRVFGDGLFGWKMASLMAIALTLPVFYWLLRQALGVRAAVFGTLVLGASHYLFAYAHTGYDNVDPIFPTTAALAMLLAGLRRNSLALLFAAGLFAGLGVYTFYSSRVVIGLLLVLILVSEGRRFKFAALASVVAGFVVFALPIFAVDRWDVIDATLSQSPSKAQLPFWPHAMENIPRTLFAWSFNPSEHHYVAGALMDEVSVVLAVAGFLLALTRIHQFGYRLLIIWFVTAALVSGVFSPYAEVSVTRLHYAVPPLAAFAGAALDRMVAALGRLVRGPRLEWTFGALTFAALAPTLFIINGRHFFIYSAQHSPTPTDTVITRELVAPRCRDQALRSVLYHPAPEQILDPGWSFFGMRDNKPVQIRFDDMPWAYNAYPATGGVGCVVMPNVTEPEWSPLYPLITRTIGLMKEGAAREDQEFQVVTDLTGAPNRQTALLVGGTGEGRLLEQDIPTFWRTDLSHGDGVTGVVKAQEKSYIYTIDSPNLRPIAEATLLTPADPVVVVPAGSSAIAYPLRYLMWHHIANDVVDGQPIAVTFDPIAGTAKVFSRLVNGQVLDFGNSGLMRSGNALLYDHQTETWWQQMTGAAVTGELAGSKLQELPFVVASWAAFAGAYPDGRVVVLENPRPQAWYERNPYLGYDVPKGKPVFTRDEPDPRLPPMQRVAVINVLGKVLSFPFPRDASQEHVRALELGTTNLVLFFDPRAASLLDTTGFAQSRPVGTMAAYLDAERRTFAVTKDGVVDASTGSIWSLFGRAVTGPDQGMQLVPVSVVEGFWFAIAAAFPGIELQP